jgi:DNA recombination protein RmuC
MSEPTIIAAITIATVGLAALTIWLLVARRQVTADPGLFLVQQQLDALRGQLGASLEGNARALTERTEGLQTQLSARLQEVTRAVNDRLAENSQTLHKVHEALGTRLDTNLQMVGQRVSETVDKLRDLEVAAGRIFELGKDLTSLQEILQPPKLRGGVGEVLLENLLRDRLPQAQFTMQHRFSNGTSIDAVIRLDEHLVPVDSKFPLEGFRAMLRAGSDDERAKTRREFIRQVQGHIKTIAEKYILPGEGTFDFALMYVPAENVYYEAIVQGDEAEGLYAFAMDRRVIPVSPTTFYAYLVALVYGLKGMQVERQAATIRKGLAHLALEFERVRQPLDTLGQQIRHVQGNYDKATRALDRFGDRLQVLSGVTVTEPEPLLLPLGGNGADDLK